MTQEQTDQQVMDDYTGKPYALIGAVILDIIGIVVAGTTGFMYLLEMICG